MGADEGKEGEKGLVFDVLLG
jgi:hypothetical protein